MDDARGALSEEDSVGAFERLAGVVRHGPAEETSARLAALCAFLEREPDAARPLGEALRVLLSDLRLNPALIESGITSSAGFATELGARIARRFLPDLDVPDDIRAVIRRLFPGRDDHLRVNRVPDALWVRLLTALGVEEGAASTRDPEIAVAIRTLAHNAASLGLQPAFTRRLSPREDADSPFLSLPDRVLHYLQHRASDGDPRALLQHVLRAISECRAEVEHVRATMGQLGTSLALTSATFRLLQLLDRMDVLLHLTDRSSGFAHACAVRLFREIVGAEKTRNHLFPHLRAHADRLAYQVVEHAARKGGKYITTGRRDYARFFGASLGGGAIVALFAFLKIGLGKLGAPLGVEALLYGLNYSACFVLIYLTGAALATKQPAMTANTIAQALGNRQDRHLEQLEALVVRVWRSQFVSFVGNLSMALPMAFAISEVYYRSTGATVADAEYARSMLAALHPWQSGTLAFAAIAGVFLFVAGLLSGWVDNRNRYAHVPQRVARHGTLVRLVGAPRAQAAADFLDRNLGVLVGNVFLGFALGSTGTIGEIFGLPLDIRHIAFASAELGTALEILHGRVAFSLLWPVVAGVILIGLVNFLVSFGLSLATALESRQITWGEIRILAVHLAGRFRRRPLNWFFP
ncbi:MAG: hypothetical protein R3247_12260, partial [Rhodothermales bacterium]|nr:hypothetical protein [Rhodothermales bacterium]